MTITVEREVDALVDINKDFVLALVLVRIFHRDWLVDGGRWGRLGIELGHFDLGRGPLDDDGVVEHVRLDNLRARALGIAPFWEGGSEGSTVNEKGPYFT